MEASIPASRDGLSRVIIPWLCFSASIAFMIWVVLSEPAKLQNVPIGLGRYIGFVPAALAASGALTALLWFFAAWRIAERLSYVSCVFYFACLKTLGWSFAPWVCIAVAAIGLFRTKDSALEIRPSLLLLHLMGTMAGLYTAFRVNDFLEGWDPFKDVIRSLWLLTVN